MNFSFSEEQSMFRKSLSELLSARVDGKYLRTLSTTNTGHDPELWQEFVDLGLLGMCVSERSGGLGLQAVDFVLLSEECGKSCLAEPLVDTVLVIAPMLEAMGEPVADILAQLISGKKHVSIGNLYDNFVSEAHIAEWILMPAEQGKHTHALGTKDFSYSQQDSIDTTRRLFTLDWEVGNKTCVSTGATDLWRATHHRAALGVAAQLLGLSQTMLDMAVKYCAERKQFSKPIGSFQAVKHMLANVAIGLECARPVIYRAASVLSAEPLNSIAVAHARLAASQVSKLAAKNCLQAHGAMGYTWEVDLHFWMKRAWCLDKSWGDNGIYKDCLLDYLDQVPNDRLGAGQGLLAEEFRA